VKLDRASAARFCARPEGGRVGALLHGADAGQVAGARDRLLAALVGPDAEAEMRLTRLTGADLRADPAALDSALRAQGFFPGPRAVLVAAATDGLADALAAALEGAAQPDAFLLVTADALNARSALRKRFEAAPDAVAIAFYPDPPDRDEIAAMARAAGAREITPEAAEALSALGADRGALARLLEVCALYAGAGGAVDAAAVEACAPPAGDAGVDAALDAALAGRPAAVRAQLSRLAARGAGPTEIALASLRRLRLLHAAAAGGQAGRAAAMRVFPFDRRDAVLAAARRLGAARLEAAIGRVLAVDAAARGPAAGIAAAMLERALLRLAGEAAR